jgi:hypothetical protein
MARSSVQFTYERTYTLRHPKFKLFKNVEYLDAARLSKGSHSIELGKFEGCNCDCVVMGRIRGGMLKGIEYPKCEHATKIPSKLARKFETARKELTRGGPKWVDIPVQSIARSAAARRGIIVVITTSGDCYEVCIDPGTGLQTCWICCPGWCIGPSEPHAAIF